MYGQGGIRTPSVSNVTDLQSAAFKPFGTPTQKKLFSLSFQILAKLQFET